MKSVAIAGVGGIGSFVAKGIYDMGWERSQFPTDDYEFHVFDDDRVETGNLLHQNFVADDVGKFKAELIADRYIMQPVTRFMTKKDFAQYDMILCCVDSMTFRKDLYESTWDVTNPKHHWIDGRCSSRQYLLANSFAKKDLLQSFISDNNERTGCLRAVDKRVSKSYMTPQIVAAFMVQQFLDWHRNELSAGVYTAVL